MWEIGATYNYNHLSNRRNFKEYSFPFNQIQPLCRRVLPSTAVHNSLRCG